MAKKITRLAVLTALALALSFCESFFPLSFIVPLPGIKIGLSNIVVTFVLIAIGVPEASMTALLKSLLGGLIYAGPTGAFMSFCGGIVSVLAIGTIRHLFKDKISVTALSSFGGMFHNIGQLAGSLVLLKNAYVLSYAPILLISGALCGLLTGATTHFLMAAINRYHTGK